MTGKIAVFLVVFACQEPKYVICEQVAAIRQSDSETCQLNRPAAVSIIQRKMREDGIDGWLTFSECQLVLEEENGTR